MQTLLDDRVLLCDCRWYFDHGPCFSGKGGNVGILQDDAWKASSEALFAKWGKYLGKSVPCFRKTQSRVDAMSIRDGRRNPRDSLDN